MAQWTRMGMFADARPFVLTVAVIVVGCVAPRGFAGGAVTISIDPQSPAQETELFVGEQIRLQAEYDGPTDDLGGWRWWTDGASSGSYDANYTAVSESPDNPYSWSTPDTHVVHAQINNNNNNPEDDITITVKSASVILTIHEIADGGAIGKQVQSVPAGDPVRLKAKLDGNQNGEITIFAYRKDRETGEWEELGPPDWPKKPQTNNSVATVDTDDLDVAQYKFKAWYDANDDDNGYDEANPDTGETDEDQVEGTFEVTKIVINGQKINGVREEGQIRFAGPIEIRAEIEPDNPTVRALRYRFKWTLNTEGLTNADITPELDWGDGIHAKGIGRPPDNPAGAVYPNFTLVTLPDGNKQFGDQTVSLDVVDYGKSKTGDIRLFFARDGNNHPNPGRGQTSNWYYYWSQEGNPAVCMYSRDPDHEDYATWSTPPSEHPNAYGAHKNGIVSLFDNAAEKTEGWDYSFPEGQGASNDWIAFTIDKVDNAPDFVNLTYAHEATHKIYIC